MASWIDILNQERRQPLYEALADLQDKLTGQDKALAAALGEIEWVRRFVGSPEHILGSLKTKHGEIAEVAEVGVRRAAELLRGGIPSAFWSAQGAERFAPEDYGIDGTAIQSKFYNGLANTLKGVVEHARRYDGFGREDGAYYHIPRDQFEVLEKLLGGERVEVAQKTARVIEEQLAELEALKGRGVEDLVRPASHGYAEVQLGHIQETLDGHENALGAENTALKGQIVNENKGALEDAAMRARPTLVEAGKVAAVGAAVGIGVRVTTTIFRKWKKDGKQPADWTTEDWQEIGLDAGKAAAEGGVSATTLYLLTNCTQLSAPFAGAVVSSGRAIATLVQQYRGGEISEDELSNLSIVASGEAGMAAAGAALGQMLIPIPVLGALVGSVAARLAASHLRALLEAEGEVLAQRLQDEYNDFIASSGKAHQQVLAVLEEQMLRLGEITELAFDLRINVELLLAASIVLAEEYGVEKHDVMRSAKDVDRFMDGRGQKLGMQVHRSEPARLGIGANELG